MTVNEIKEFIYENHYNQISLTKSESDYALKTFRR